MYVYIQSEPRLWTVGFYNPDGKWESESDHASTEEAAARVSYLNGNRITDPRSVEVLDMIIADMESDVKAFEGKPFTGKTLGELHGTLAATLQALAKIVKKNMGGK